MKITRWLPLGIVMAVWFVAVAPLRAGGSDSDTQSLRLRIENAADQEIRCVAVLAHFVTRALPAIPNGGTTEITLERGAETGTLSYGSHGDRPMMLENLLCGTTADWTATSRDLPVLPLRSDPALRFAYRCGLEQQRLSCVTR